ncbi:NYN domain-containing protein [Angustibacter luteus]|uniref:NYN domain-containing protein n=1 Tax=Angustibacter luteus TaxID=658456 RepID=A0ABW1JBZ9_9ACTN
MSRETASEPLAAAPVLPDVVRRRVLDAAATALGELAPELVPAGLARVRGFAPARRAGSGATPLAAALERDAGFRAEAASVVRQSAPELSAALAAGEVPAAADPVDVAVTAYLLRPDGWQATLEAALQQVRQRAEAGAVAQDARELTRLRTELAAARAQLDTQQSESEQRVRALDEELAEVRRELRRHRSDADRARAQGKAAEQAAQERAAAADERVRESQAQAARAQGDLARAQDALEALRRADREGRSLAGSRARLLLDTVVDAAVGLRRELGLPPADVLPADLVGAHDPSAGAPVTASRAREEDDPTRLTELLLMPRAHLVVDGYNVTKSAYGELPLVDQRSRLVSGLSALAARTGAEVTCCFDGAVVEGRVSAPAARGVRVRFSDPGQTADELIRRLVRAEPTGRVVVVVSSDREVADGVRRSGARPVPSAALVKLLTRG